MNFTEALAAMIDRKFVARETWFVDEKKIEDDVEVVSKKLPLYLGVLPGMTTVFQIQSTPLNVGNYLFKLEDYQATDWILV